MSTERDVTGTVQSWLKEDAHEDADRVMFAVLQALDTTPQRRAAWSVRGLFARPGSLRLVVAGAAVLAVAVLGFVLTHPNVGVDLPSGSPGTSFPLPALSQRFSSPVHRYSISYPAGWSVQPASEPWLAALPSEPQTDHFAKHTADTLTVTSQTIPERTTFEQWLTGYIDSLDPTGCCVPSASAWTAINIGSQRGLRWYAGYSVGAAVVAVSGRAYVFRAQTRLNTLSEGVDGADPDRYLDADLFRAMLATVQFDAASVSPSATPLPALTETFTSRIHGYSISYPAAWTAQPATEPMPAGFAPLDAQATQAVNDHFAADTTDLMKVTSQLIPDGTTYEEWLTGYRGLVLTENSDCTIQPAVAWPAINIGGRPGLMWNTGPCVFGGGAVVAVGRRVYVFTATTRHNPQAVQEARDYLNPDLFRAMLATVKFDPASAVDAP